MVKVCWILGLLGILHAHVAEAQDLEPRRWSHLPSGVNFVGVGIGTRTGDILFDPVLQIEDGEFDLYSFGATYIRTFGLFGKSARVDLTIPYAGGRWEGLLAGEPASVRRTGLADPIARLSINLYGAPSLRGSAFAQYRAQHQTNTTVGAALALVAPLGEFDSDRLINLGGDRWIARPQIGVLHERQKWQFELTGSVFLFEDQEDFFRGASREQNALWFIQGHLIHTFRPGLWVSLSSGYAYGGRSTVDGARKSDDARASYWAVKLGVPLSRTQGLAFSYLVSETNTRLGSNINAFTMSWTLMFGH